ncbi:AimR family lysis-lysogeny pheromone receptor [Aquibacillus kalidii]|uniref:AimR family lysis-lysogeny pheromone receptor n=1 Tax=Aquibacillus kalidii TaxID=2762597 RepID=UPI001C9A0403|nr:AimR family lysis-lysogeny pheromone receptor [Aquibacillus kalidii]
MTGFDSTKSSILKEYQNYNPQLNLNQFITMVSIDNDEKAAADLAKQFCLQTESAIDMRIGMEYLYLNGFYTELDFLIIKNKQSENPINRKWGAVYELMVARRNYNRPAQTILHHAQEIKTSLPELKCLLIFLKISLDYSGYKYDSLGYYLDEINDLIMEVENPLLASLFRVRLNTLLFIYYWKRNELILARKHAYQAINQTFNVERKVQLHINLALSYIYEDYHSSVYHLDEALKSAELFDKSQLISVIKNRNYPFICAHFGEVEGLKTKDLSEQAHIEIARGNLKEAQRILERVNQDTPFHKYYMGLATGNEQFLFSSYNEFIEKRSDHFFARLPLQKIKRKAY